MRPSRFPDLDDYDTEDESPSNWLRQRNSARHENDTTMRDSPDYGMGATVTVDMTGFHDSESIMLPPPLDLDPDNGTEDDEMHDSSLNTSDTTGDVTDFHDSQTIVLPPPLDLGLDYLTEEDEVPMSDLRRKGNTADEAKFAADTKTALDISMRDAVPSSRIVTAPSLPLTTMLDLDLPSMGVQERNDIYEDLFKRDVPVTNIAIPPIAFKFPELQDEIIQAYLDHTTFVFTILTNFDVAIERFYTSEPLYNSARHSDCGKIQRSPRQAKHLRSINVQNIEFKNVRLDISSHLATLAEVTLEVRESGSTVKVDKFVNLFYTGYPPLEDFIHRIADRLTDPERDVTGGKPGFSWDDLEHVAKWFVFKQTEAVARVRQRYQYCNDRTWEGKDNTAYLSHLNGEKG
ncbi:hypothetical protein LTR56_011789 [Elasticomyces elasticus]|nr:hypothetical protein LTR22_024337 [Elasticomyces elasticus]KAK3640697.1 hypothetical protein LTR56_011789 [Elasticomyces elasticus]KAK4929022.1 hypothetical protein LTR49_004219 [Elasticomyces elasticus]KAK5750376.1 hypothetical protein LTS12_019562 [Elasticomyces elasticus]